MKFKKKIIKKITTNLYKNTQNLIKNLAFIAYRLHKIKPFFISHVFLNTNRRSHSSV